MDPARELETEPGELEVYDSIATHFSRHITLCSLLPTYAATKDIRSFPLYIKYHCWLGSCPNIIVFNRAQIWQ
jgi:hypothetical protein